MRLNRQIQWKKEAGFNNLQVAPMTATVSMSIRE
jgi:hypothetical protein